MRSDVVCLLDANAGVVSRQALLASCGRAYANYLIRHRDLVAVFPRAYARPWDVDLTGTRLRAALVSVGGEVALSHLTALARWDLPCPDDVPLHVTAINPRHPRVVAGELVVHRTLLPLRARWHGQLPVVDPAVAAVSSWSLLSGSAARAPLIEGRRRGLLNPDGLRRAVASARRTRGVAELRRLVADVLAGCESELELYGYRAVFDVPGLRHAVRQLTIRVGGVTYRADLAYETERVIVELDGRAYHASPAQWSRDIARDLALATVGWQTVRLSHARLMTDVDGVRRDVLAVLAARRASARAS